MSPAAELEAGRQVPTTGGRYPPSCLPAVVVYSYYRGLVKNLQVSRHGEPPGTEAAARAQLVQKIKGDLRHGGVCRPL